jgi:DNA-binding beta-propeller fold protein YncE
MKVPHSIAADANGYIYVADGGNGRIQVFDNNLRLIAIYDAVGSPWALCITRGPHQYLYASSNDDRTDATRGRSTDPVYKMELDGTIVGRFGRSDNALGRFPTLHSIDCRTENKIVAIGVGWAGLISLQP